MKKYLISFLVCIASEVVLAIIGVSDFAAGFATCAVFFVMMNHLERKEKINA